MSAITASMSSANSGSGGAASASSLSASRSGRPRRAAGLIAALANNFGGVLLIGVDETRQGPDSLPGVDAGERDPDYLL